MGSAYAQGDGKWRQAPNFRERLAADLTDRDRRNINILRAFLPAALDLPEAELSRLVIVDPHLKREFQDDKIAL
jgi:hypothetical protein